MDKDKKKIIGQESMHTIRNGEGELLSVLCRDPKSGDHVVYFTSKGTSEDIAERLIKSE